MFSKVWARKESNRHADKLEDEDAFYQSSSSTYCHSSGRFLAGPLERRRNSAAPTVEVRVTTCKWLASPMAARKTTELEATTRADNGGGGGGGTPALVSSTNRLLTADDSGGSSGCRKPRGRSMSARKSNELRPHVDSPPKQPQAGGSVRVRRTSEMVNEIGQLRLTPVQITLVRKLWQNVRAQGKNGAGLQILRDHLFFRYPDIRELFAAAARPGAAETSYHKRLMAHAEALGELLDEVISNLEQADSLRDKIRDLGKLHIVSREIGFKAMYWDCLAEALNECTLTWCQKAQRRFETQVAMTTIVMFIIDNMKNGYMDECRRLRRSVYDGGSRERHHASNGLLGQERDGARSPRHKI